MNKRLAVRYVPFLLTKDCVYAREAALESAVLPCPHIYKRFQACCLVLAHKDRHFMELIKWFVADMRYIHFISVL